jgi:hypothetical protein
MLVTRLAERIAAFAPARRIRVAVDAPPAAQPERLAGALIDPLRVRGRAALWLSTEDFLRPASLRYEYGRESADAFYDGWYDLAGLRREALDPLGAGGTSRVLPRLWDASTDRASRAGYVELPPGAVLLVAGPLLLGAGLPFDLTVHLSISAAALARRTPPAQRWTLAAFARYQSEVAPDQFADLVIRMDDPDRPALYVRDPAV